MARVDLRKTVYNKLQFDKVVGGREFKTFTLSSDDIDFTVEDFFTEYDNLFLEIPINGPNNSHEALVRRSGELVGFQRTTDEIQPLLDEIASLREQLLEARQEIVDLQIGDVNEDALRSQFNDLLEALSEPIQFPDIIIAGGVDDDGKEEGEEEEIPLVKPVDDVILVSIDEDKTINRGSVNVLENDAAASLNKIRFAGIKDGPKYGKVEVLDEEEGIVQYIPDLRAPSGPKADRFTYTITDGKGLSEVGTVFINIDNKALLVTEPGNDVIMLDIYVDDQTRPNETAKFDDNSFNLLDNDEGLDLEFVDIVSQPKFGSITVLDQEQGIIKYTPRFGITSGQIDMNAFFTPGAGVTPVTEDEFFYRVKNLNTAARTADAKVTVRINVFDSIVDPNNPANNNNTSDSTSSSNEEDTSSSISNPTTVFN